MCRPGYGFAAIIVAFVGRLHPVGMVFSAMLMSMFYIGGELAQSRLGLPKSLTGVFQGLLLFTLLACDTLIAYRAPLGGREGRRVMESYALAAGRHAERGHRAGHRGAGPADQREGRHRQPGRRGHDAVRRHRRLCHRGAHRQRLAGLCRRAWRRGVAGGHLWPAGDLAQHQPVRHRGWR
jgi:hypothetical protein